MTQLAEPLVHLWTCDEYFKMAAIGLFDQKRVELLEGQVIEMSPMGSLHVTAVTLAADLLRAAFPSGWVVRVQGPLMTSAIGAPEPDVALVQGHARDYKDSHPTTAALIIEVADSSLA